MMSLCFFMVSLLPVSVWAHGRLTAPMTRIGRLGYENDPVSGSTGDDFICRHRVRNPNVPLAPVTAGSTLDLTWDFSANHVGDCAVYIAYCEGTCPRETLKFFKIANVVDCREFTAPGVFPPGGDFNDGIDRTIKIDLPSWLPAGRAVLRWDWVALHVAPTLEFYAQCSDVQISNPGTAVDMASIPTYSITSPSIYPATGNTGVGFRNGFGGISPGQPGFYLTGPECALGFTGNDCEETKAGTRGNTFAAGQTAPTPPPVPLPPTESTPPPSTTPPAPTTAPPPPTASCSGSVSHTVSGVQNLALIAGLYPQQNVDWIDICTANQLSANCATDFAILAEVLAAGTTLTIPCGDTVGTDPAEPPSANTPPPTDPRTNPPSVDTSSPPPATTPSPTTTDLASPPTDSGLDTATGGAASTRLAQICFCVIAMCVAWLR